MRIESFGGKHEKDTGRIKLSMEEWKKYCGGNADLGSEEQKRWMSEKGIKFDSGVVEIEIDGQSHEMVTDRNDFGTLLENEDEKRAMQDLMDEETRGIYGSNAG